MIRFINGLDGYERLIDNQELYTNDNLFRQGCFINVQTINGEHHEISVHHYHMSESGYGTGSIDVLYKGVKLSDIQVYGILKDLYGIYCEGTIDRFLHIIESISISHMGGHSNCEIIPENWESIQSTNKGLLDYLKREKSL